MSKFWQQLMNIWSRLEIAQKATIVLAGLGFLALIGTLAYTATRPDYRLLAKGLSKAQVAEIAAYLDANHIAYTVADNESAVMIPSQYLYKVRNELAQQDKLGDGSRGFELLGKSSSMWESTFSEHKTYDRAVSGELERSFRELPGVRGARVLIDRPQPSPFSSDDDAKPKASIKLDMAVGQRLSERQIAGVIHLTAGAIAGLSPDRVEIMDSTGLLTPKGADSTAMFAQTTLEAEAARERYLTRKAQDQLDTVLGPGRSQVQVSVKLDFTKRTESSSDPGKRELLEEKTSSNDEKNETSNPGGVAGTAPNVEGESRTTKSEPLRGSKTREETENKYVVGKKTITQEDEVGRIKGMNVAILLPFKQVSKPKLDDQGKPTKEMETTNEEYAQAEKDRFKELVLNAIGFNAAKDITAKSEAGQNLDARFTSSVQSMDLYRAPETVAAASLALPLTSVPWVDAAGYGIAGIVALTFIFVARGQLKRSHLAWKEAEERARALVDAERVKNAPPEEVVEDQAEDRERQALKIRRTELREQIKKKILEDPNAASQIVRKWMYET
jgi:flagellar M-ring protein FliF